MNTAEENLIPKDYVRVTEGRALAGDKYWSYALNAWLPVTVNSGAAVSGYPAVIRKKRGAE